jgi:hypothetical protein
VETLHIVNLLSDGDSIGIAVKFLHTFTKIGKSRGLEFTAPPRLTVPQ